MIYNLRIGFNDSHWKEIKAETKEEAEKIAEAFRKDFVSRIKASIDNVKPKIEESEKNFRLVRGAVYLIRKYKRQVPAKCLESCRSCGIHEYEHKFRYLDNSKTIWLKGKFPPRLLSKLCDNGKINKPECNTCPGKFYCYTQKI